MYISSLYYNKEGLSNVEACIYHHFIISRKDKKKLRYVYINTSLQTGIRKKSFGMYISSLHYNTKGRAKRARAVFIYQHFIKTRKDKQKFWYVYKIAFL